MIAICNTNGATIPRESDAVIYTHAGPEIGVASTKGFRPWLPPAICSGCIWRRCAAPFSDEIAAIMGELPPRRR
ncbi:MAG: SIS domain-containing protein [Micropruina glycogenica]